MILVGVKMKKTLYIFINIMIKSAKLPFYLWGALLTIYLHMGYGIEDNQTFII